SPLVRQSLFNLRQAAQHRVADSLQTLRRNLIQRIFLRVPVLAVICPVGTQLNDIHRVDAGPKKRSVIVIADTLEGIHKYTAVTKLFRCLPDRIDKPGRTQISTAEAEVL